MRANRRWMRWMIVESHEVAERALLLRRALLGRGAA